VPLGHSELLLSFASKVDTNKAGLRRAKKVNFATFSTKGKAKVEPTMEVLLVARYVARYVGFY
jgi:hypothetical protein